ncbi:MAG: phosphatidylglycerophosphate synthase [Bradymonadia bacterium]
MFAKARRIYRESLKPADSLFNLYIARPPAAVVVAGLANTRVTPNQVTVVSMLVQLIAAALFIAVPGWLGLVLGVVAVELSYIFDCVDGQLARVTGRSSPVGGLFDFLMDELKAYVLVAALAARWYLHDGGGVLALFVGLGTLVVVASAIALTKFTRTAEYAEATGTAQVQNGTSAGQRKGPLWPIMMAARLISQYPVTLPIFAVFGRMDIFLYAYAGVHVLYLGQTTLGVLLKLARFAKD